MADCGDLERGIRDMDRRLRDLERRAGSSGGGGGGGGNVDEERIVRKAVERVYSDERWKANFRILRKIILGAGN